ncbi:hypothetical protein SEA_DARDANUS_71 [Gordonia phage Dardanus]|uniref:Uncharacterized protein n=1 Tax=Gordonia phage Dardanus TaxID=2588489 RepID=A0A514CX71_9CAUD|nr:hypothetical protein KDJ58_gp71 [Gordonia phage Dardanus]QDH85108.1 hypothetical protein SEA_DARDANUS_71 [Gordonia phage Dardanus]
MVIEYGIRTRDGKTRKLGAIERRHADNLCARFADQDGQLVERDVSEWRPAAASITQAIEASQGPNGELTDGSPGG